MIQQQNFSNEAFVGINLPKVSNTYNNLSAILTNGIKSPLNRQQLKSSFQINSPQSQSSIIQPKSSIIQQSIITPQEKSKLGIQILYFSKQPQYKNRSQHLFATKSKGYTSSTLVFRRSVENPTVLLNQLDPIQTVQSLRKNNICIRKPKYIDQFSRIKLFGHENNEQLINSLFDNASFYKPSNGNEQPEKKSKLGLNKPDLIKVRSQMLNQYNGVNKKLSLVTLYRQDHNEQSNEYHYSSNQETKPLQFQEFIRNHLQKHKKQQTNKDQAVVEVTYQRSLEEYKQQQEAKEKKKPEKKVIVNDPALEDACYRSKKLETTEEEKDTELKRQELINSISQGQKQLANQSKMMQNRNYRMLVKEGNRVQTKKKVCDFKSIRQALVSSLYFLKKLKLTPKIIMQTQVFSFKPFQKKGAQEFIKACKQNNISLVQEMVKENRFLVYDFDYVQLTPLHWVSKRGYFAIAQLLCNSGADVDAQDLIGRTPLYFAIEHGFIELVQLFLEMKASPWSTGTINYNEIGVNQTAIMKLINKARKLHILLSMTPPAIRDEIWQNQVEGSLKI